MQESLVFGVTAWMTRIVILEVYDSPYTAVRARYYEAVETKRLRLKKC